MCVQARLRATIRTQTTRSASRTPPTRRVNTIGRTILCRRLHHHRQCCLRRLRQVCIRKWLVSSKDAVQSRHSHLYGVFEFMQDGDLQLPCQKQELLAAFSWLQATGMSKNRYCQILDIYSPLKVENGLPMDCSSLRELATMP